MEEKLQRIRDHLEYVRTICCPQSLDPRSLHNPPQPSATLRPTLDHPTPPLVCPRASWSVRLDQSTDNHTPERVSNFCLAADTLRSSDLRDEAGWGARRSNDASAPHHNHRHIHPRRTIRDGRLRLNGGHQTAPRFGFARTQKGKRTAHGHANPHPHHHPHTLCIGPSDNALHRHGADPAHDLSPVPNLHNQTPPEILKLRPHTDARAPHQHMCGPSGARTGRQMNEKFSKVWASVGALDVVAVMIAELADRCGAR